MCCTGRNLRVVFCVIGWCSYAGVAGELWRWAATGESPYFGESPILRKQVKEPIGKMVLKTLLPVFLCFMVLSASPAVAGDYLIVPGQRVGSVALGLSPQAVRQRLHAPKMVRRLPSGIVEESWVSQLTLAQQHSYKDKGLYWKVLFVNVYFRRGQVTQIEVSSPQFHTLNNLSVNSPAKAFESHYRPYHSSDRPDQPPYGTLDQSGGYPGYKHYVTIDDAVQAGIAWRYGAWGDLAPEPDPSLQEVVIVHRRGQPVIREPDASNRFVVTSHDPGFDSQSKLDVHAAVVRLVGIWVDADPRPDASKLVVRADHSFRMYKGSAYRKRTATGFISLPRTVSGTWAWEGGYKPVLELTWPGHYGEFFTRASGHLVAVHESGVKGLPYEMRRLLPARRD